MALNRSQNFLLIVIFFKIIFNLFEIIFQFIDFLHTPQLSLGILANVVPIFKL